MSEINFGKTVSLKQAAKLIVSNPDCVFMLRGEPGIGKSSMLESIAEAVGCDYAYIDVPNMDLGDIAMPVIDHTTKTTRYYPNARFKFHEGKPVIIMLDEFSKGADPVKNMLHPLFEKVNPRLGDLPRPQGSYCFLTGNLTTDGVGDSLKAHSWNRIVPVVVRKPSAEEWIEWAMNSDKQIAPEVVAWVHQFPHCLASYLDGDQKENPYIFNPKNTQRAFVSPRSLETASNIVRSRSKNDTEAVIAALTGAIGEAGARDMQAYIEFSDQLPTWEQTIKEPKTARVPEGAGACAIVVFGGITRITKETIKPFMEYLERFEAEWQAVFAVNIARTPSKQSIAFSSEKFAEWVAKNQDLL
jgi:hypothetical protein